MIIYQQTVREDCKSVCVSVMHTRLFIIKLHITVNSKAPDC